jgi:hypothetical protein
MNSSDSFDRSEDAKESQNANCKLQIADLSDAVKYSAFWRLAGLD